MKFVHVPKENMHVPKENMHVPKENVHVPIGHPHVRIPHSQGKYGPERLTLLFLGPRRSAR
jgi:hypothetical protein